jgi:hypothetical protein
MDSKPTHEQARLQLQLFEERREPRIRQARDWYFRNYHPETLEDTMRVAAPGSEGQQFAMMVLTYWEQACAMLNYGLLHEDLFFETNGEFFGVWEAAKTIVPKFREMFKNPHFLENLEKASKRYEAWSEKRSPGHIAAMREMMKQMRAQMAAKAA